MAIYYNSECKPMKMNEQLEIENEIFSYSFWGGCYN